MPFPRLRWRHVVINTRGSWLHGDRRGFRSRKHRIHSSGDYRNPPPPQEHAGLRVYHAARSGEEIHLDDPLRPIVGRVLRQHLGDCGFQVIAVAVGKVHAHIAVELPDAMPQIKRIIGDAKRVSSRAVKQSLPGAVWSAGGTYKPIDSRDRLEWVHDYIIYDQGPTAWTWSHRDASDDGQFQRARPRTR